MFGGLVARFRGQDARLVLLLDSWTVLLAVVHCPPPRPNNALSHYRPALSLYLYQLSLSPSLHFSLF